MTPNAPNHPEPPGGNRGSPIADLHELSKVPLNAMQQAVLAQAYAQSLGPEPWRQRKRKAFRDVLALLNAAPRRLELMFWRSTEELWLVLRMIVTVPCMLPDGRLVVMRDPILELRYPQEVMTQSLPGTAFVRVAQPASVWLANAAPVGGVLCLGKQLPRNIPVHELLWLAYVALSGQTANFDVQDYAGVLNADAAHYWAAHQDRLPLMNESFLHQEAVQGGVA